MSLISCNKINNKNFIFVIEFLEVNVIIKLYYLFFIAVSGAWAPHTIKYR